MNLSLRVYGLFLLFCILHPPGSLGLQNLNCSACPDPYPLNCTKSECILKGCTSFSGCTGTCTLIVLETDGSRLGVSTCMSEVNSLEDIYREDQLGSECKQISEAVLDVTSNFSTFSCTCQSDHCNGRISLIEEIEPEADINPIIALVVGVGVITLVVIVIIVRVIVLYRRKIRDKKEKEAMKNAGKNRFSADSSSLLEGGWDDMGKHSYSAYKYSTSMSSQYTRGSKGNALNQNDQHLPIELDEIIGRGRFAEVWRAKLQQESNNSKVVSVKVFRLPNYGAWRQEKEILSESWMRHENIIEYYATEQHQCRGRLQYWLITAYYRKGSLQEYLRNNSLKWPEVCDMIASICKGLAYLHDEHDLNGKEKFPVAHRDIKSCNILVKDDGVSCVLADFGLSLKLDPSLSKDELANAGQVGTSRYMAPELLERLVNLTDIEMFKRVDMYAFSLVMWEIAGRCELIEGVVQPYQPPFGDRINDHPTKEQILILVCRQKEKPEIRQEWRSHSGMNKLANTMSECWDSEPEARLTARCVYERILTIREQDDIVEDAEVSDKVVEAKEALEENEKNELNELISTVV